MRTLSFIYNIIIFTLIPLPEMDFDLWMHRVAIVFSFIAATLTIAEKIRTYLKNKNTQENEHQK